MNIERAKQLIEWLKESNRFNIKESVQHLIVVNPPKTKVKEPEGT